MRCTKNAATLTCEAIRDSSERCCIEQGRRSASLGDIAGAAGVTRRAAYWHFKDKRLLRN
ncbi:TetR family transcriptional regulator [Burkholderia pseudomultivorans]|uniref:TetR family transcriptional regulator n=1 Tax=Burkholderia pseudomultivorans TaxID=1207504 RepID=UPI0009C11ACE